MTVYLLHVGDGGRLWWVLTDGVLVMRSEDYRSPHDVQNRWVACHGHPMRWVRFKGVLRPSEAAAVVEDLAAGRRVFAGAAAEGGVA